MKRVYKLAMSLTAMSLLTGAASVTAFAKNGIDQYTVVAQRVSSSDILDLLVPQAPPVTTALANILNEDAILAQLRVHTNQLVAWAAEVIRKNVAQETIASR